jgi:hypothetical protein
MNNLLLQKQALIGALVVELDAHDQAGSSAAGGFVEVVLHKATEPVRDGLRDDANVFGFSNGRGVLHRFAINHYANARDRPRCLHSAKVARTDDDPGEAVIDDVNRNLIEAHTRRSGDRKEQARDLGCAPGREGTSRLR